MTDGKLEFASPAWIAAFRELIFDFATTADPALDVTLCGIFTDVPSHLDRHGTGKIAWYCRLRGGRAEFAEHEIAGADYTAVADYDFALRLARWVYDPSTQADLDDLRARGIREGKLRGVGDRAAAAILAGVHNQIAARTL